MLIEVLFSAWWMP